MVDKVSFHGTNIYHLVRESDRSGYKGPIIEAVERLCGDSHPNLIQVGMMVRVGSYKNELSPWDYWQSTPILSIDTPTENEEGDLVVRFTTRNSVYHLKVVNIV